MSSSSIALSAGATLVGVNNRNLRTLAVDVKVSADLIGRMPRDVTAVAESGFVVERTGGLAALWLSRIPRGRTLDDERRSGRRCATCCDRIRRLAIQFGGACSAASGFSGTKVAGRKQSPTKGALFSSAGQGVRDHSARGRPGCGRAWGVCTWVRVLAGQPAIRRRGTCEINRSSLAAVCHRRGRFRGSATGRRERRGGQGWVRGCAAHGNETPNAARASRRVIRAIGLPETTDISSILEWPSSVTLLVDAYDLRNTVGQAVRSTGPWPRGSHRGVRRFSPEDCEPKTSSRQSRP